MAKYDVTHSCGHDTVKDIVGPVADRARKAKWFASKPCYECARAAEDAARAALPPLTQEQIQEREWARIADSWVPKRPFVNAILAAEKYVYGHPLKGSR